MTNVGTYHYQIEVLEFFLGISDDTGSLRVHHEIDFIFRMAMYRIIEFRIGVIKYNEEVFLRNRGNFLLYLNHSIRNLYRKNNLIFI